MALVLTEGPGTLSDWSGGPCDLEPQASGLQRASSSLVEEDKMAVVFIRINQKTE